MLDNHSETDSHLLPVIGTDKDKEMIDVDTWEEGDSLASLLTAQVELPTAFSYWLEGFNLFKPFAFRWK